MEAMKMGDSHKIVMEMLSNYVGRQLNQARPTKTAEVLAHLLAGIRVTRHYRVDIPEPGRSLMAREYLRGVLTDFPGV